MRVFDVLAKADKNGYNRSSFWKRGIPVYAETLSHRLFGIHGAHY